MPRNIREVRAAERAAERASLDAKVENCPSHVKQRVGQPSRLASALKVEKENAWNGSTYTPHGQVAKHENRDKGRLIGAHKNAAKALEDAQKLLEKYGSALFNRGMPQQISEIEGICIKTVYRARERLKTDKSNAAP